MQVYTCVNNGFEMNPETHFSHHEKNHPLTKDFASNLTPNRFESEEFKSVLINPFFLKNCNFYAHFVVAGYIC